MKSTRYLYDIDPCYLATLQYRDAIELKIIKGKELLLELVRVKGEVNSKRVEDIQKAIDFNEYLLKELDCRG